MNHKEIRWLSVAAILMLGLAGCQSRDEATETAFVSSHVSNAASKVSQKLE